MIVFEAWARLLSIVHLVSAAVLVGAATHQVVWCRHYLGGRFHAATAERRFVAITTIAFATTFVLGSALYPTYKVRVRVEYLDAPSAVAAEVGLRSEHAVVAGAGAKPAGAGAGAGDLGWLARLFDVKEHWVAIGLAASLALWVLARFAHPRERPEVLPAYVGLSLLVAATAWTGAIVGLVVASYRSVGAPT